MLNKTLLLAVVAVVTALALPSFAREDGGGIQKYDPIPMWPVVVYDVSGATLGGPVARSLVIYNNGRMQVSQAAGFLAEPYVFAGQVPQDKLQRLLIELDRWSHLKDETMMVADLPLHTLTTIDGDGEAQSVSWWFGVNAHQHLQEALDGIVMELFPHLEQ